MSVFSLTPHIHRIGQGIKADRTRKFMLAGTLLGDPRQPAGRRENFEWLFLGSMQAQDSGSCLES